MRGHFWYQFFYLYLYLISIFSSVFLFDINFLVVPSFDINFLSASLFDVIFCLYLYLMSILCLCLYFISAFVCIFYVFDVISLSEWKTFHNFPLDATYCTIKWSFINKSVYFFAFSETFLTVAASHLTFVIHPVLRLLRCAVYRALVLQDFTLFPQIQASFVRISMTVHQILALMVEHAMIWSWTTVATVPSSLIKVRSCIELNINNVIYK